MRRSRLVEQLGFSVSTMCEKLVPLVERGELGFEHDGELLAQAQPAGVIYIFVLDICCQHLENIRQ